MAAPSIKATMEIVEKKITPHITSLKGALFSGLTGIGKIPVHVVVANVTFSEEAKAIIKRQKLEDYGVINVRQIPNKMMQRYYRDEGQEPPERSYLVSDFLRGTVELAYLEPIAAQGGMAHLQERLKAVKSWLETADLPKSASIEL